MLLLSNHAIYRYAKRVFYQDVCDKKRNLNPKMYHMVKRHAREAIKNIRVMGNGKYPITGTPLIAVIENNTVKTFLYKAGQIEGDYV